MYRIPEKYRAWMVVPDIIEVGDMIAIRGQDDLWVEWKIQSIRIEKFLTGEYEMLVKLVSLIPDTDSIGLRETTLPIKQLIRQLDESANKCCLTYMKYKGD